MELLLDNNINYKNINFFINVEINRKYENICRYCKMTFSKNKNLKRHIRTIHVKNEIYICLICFKRFNRKDNLKTHQKKKHYHI